jgi:hypothetical protein
MEEEVLQELNNKKQELMNELKNYEDNIKQLVDQENTGSSKT